MKEKTRLRVIQILCIVSLIITVFSIQRTYARYYEKVGTTYATNIKRWVINVNSVNVHGKTGTELTEVMKPIFRENDHINSDVLVPGSEGYFEFLIDYSKVDLAFKFDFEFEQLNTENPLEDFEIYGYSIVEGETESKPIELETVNDLSGLAQIIDPEADTDDNKTIQLRVLFRWNDTNKDTTAADAEVGMNNNEDTQYVRENESLSYKVKVTFTQYVEENGSN